MQSSANFARHPGGVAIVPRKGGIVTVTCYVIGHHARGLVERQVGHEAGGEVGPRRLRIPDQGNPPLLAAVFLDRLDLVFGQGPVVGKDFAYVAGEVAFGVSSFADAVGGLEIGRA